MKQLPTPDAMLQMLQHPDCPHCQSLDSEYQTACKGCHVRHLTRSLAQHRSDYFKQLKAQNVDVTPYRNAMIAINTWDQQRRAS